MIEDRRNSSPLVPLLNAGTAQVDITPQGSLGMSGYILRQGPSNGVLDPIYARALYLEQAGQEALLFSCDLLGLHRAYVNQARLSIQDETGIPSEGIMLSCTHTHSGPATMKLLECAEVEKDYLDWLQERLVELSRVAQATAIPVRARYGKSRLDGIQENRRIPGGTVDPEVLVLALERLNGAPLAILFNFACHPTCLQPSNRLISGDYPAYAASLIREATGATPMFFTGAAGNIRPVQRGSEEAVRATGGALAGSVLEMLPELAVLETPSLCVSQSELRLPLQAAPAAGENESVRLRSGRAGFYAPQRTPDMEAVLERLLATWQAHTLAARQSGKLPDSIPVEVQVIRLGTVTWIALPGELFVELGLEIKQRLGGRQVFVCGYSNGAIGYIPTRQAYAEGGYEVEQAYIVYDYPAALAAQAGEQIVEVAVYLSLGASI